MSAFTLQTHQWKPIGKSTAVVDSVIPYRRISLAGQPPIYVQRGKCYSESGKEYKQLPQWFIERVEAEMQNNPKAFDKVGGIALMDKSARKTA